jgi:hypothetical protein
VEPESIGKTSSNDKVESEHSDMDIIINAIYELQKEIYDLKRQFEDEVEKRVVLEEFVRSRLNDSVSDPVDSIPPITVEDGDSSSTTETTQSHFNDLKLSEPELES